MRSIEDIGTALALGQIDEDQARELFPAAGLSGNEMEEYIDAIIEGPPEE